MVKLLKFQDVPVGSQVFIQTGKDWDSYRKDSSTTAQRETVLLGISIGEPIIVNPTIKVKIVD